MPACEILDTFPDFLAVWDETRDRGMDAQVEAWRGRYMSHWPELLKKQDDDFGEQGEDWRVTASERIFPFLPQRLPLMGTAHDNLLEVFPDVVDRAGQVLGCPSDVVGVIYVGLGCGAGWATDLEGRPAVLFGLENIAEEGWQGIEALQGLTAHELGHLVQSEWRARAHAADEEGPWWLLYSEGFAQRCEQVILGRSSWHMRAAPDGQWQQWCRQNVGWLAGEFLRRVDHGQDLRPFFGSWFDLRGHRQTGYYLGHELIGALQERMSLQEVASLTDLETILRPLLTDVAGSRHDDAAGQPADAPAP